jgi:hypothetical protein
VPAQLARAKGPSSKRGERLREDIMALRYLLAALEERPALLSSRLTVGASVKS